MSEFMIQETTLKGIADAIREKNKTTDEIAVADMPQQIKRNPLLAKVVTNDGNTPYSISADELRDTESDLLRRYAFYGCTGLNSVVVPENIFKINVGAFQGCIDLKRIEFLGNAEFYGSNVFANCMALDIVILRGNKVATLTFDLFLEAPLGFYTGNGGIFVPESLIEEYKSHNMWGAYAECIKPLEELENIE